MTGTRHRAPWHLGAGGAVLLAALAMGLVSAPVASAAGRGTPIRVMTIGDFETHDSDNAAWVVGVRARLSLANLRGGILDARGRRHRVIVRACNSAFDPARAAGCAQRAVRTRVAAVLGLTSVDSTEVWPVLEEAGIPVIGARINTIADGTSPVSFPVGCGLPGVFRAMPYALARSGARRIGVVISDYGEATDALLASVEQGITAAGLTAGPVAFVPPRATSVADAGTTMTEGGADGVIGFVADAHAGAVVRALDRAGFTGPYVTQAPVGVSRLASDADDTQAALLVGQFAPVTADVPGMRLFRADMDESPSGASLERTEGVVNNWLAAWVFQRVVRTLERPDASTVLRAMGRLDRLQTGGITPPLSTARAGVLLPRMFNPTVTLSRVSAGTLPQRVAPGFLSVVDGHVVP